MDTKISRKEKKSLRTQANNLIEGHCLSCSVKTQLRNKSERNLDRYCISKCNIGLELQSIGKKILNEY